MKIAMVTTCYNSEKTIKRALDSVANQIYLPDEYIIVDDASTDGTTEIVEEYAKANKEMNIRLVKLGKNVGAGMAKRIGIEEQRCDAVCFLDSDDWVMPGYILLMMKQMEQDEGMDMSCCEVTQYMGKESMNLPNGADGIINGRKAFMMYIQDKLTSAFANAKLIKSRIARSIPYSDKRFFEDADTLYKWFYESRKVGLINIPLYSYIRTEGSITMSGATRGKIIDKMLVVRGMIDFYRSKGINPFRESNVQFIISEIQSTINKCNDMDEKEKSLLNEMIQKGLFS